MNSIIFAIISRELTIFVSFINTADKNRFPDSSRDKLSIIHFIILRFRVFDCDFEQYTDRKVFNYTYKY